MAIAFARIQFVKRSEGRNSCQKAAYAGRMKVHDERTGQTFDYSHKGDSVYHEILLPKGVSEEFSKAQLLWSSNEMREKRVNSQVALEGVIALPDDACITMEDRIEITKRAAHHFFVRHGLAVQIDIHAPHDNGSGEEDHNWHAHFLAPTRSFTEGGKDLGEKAREYMARYREGNLHSGEEYRKIQNDYFKERGIDLVVDDNGIIPQVHLGPVRLRARAAEIMKRHLERVSANENASCDPARILEHLTKKQSVFGVKEVERYIRKHVPLEKQEKVRVGFWRQRGLVELAEKRYTTKEVQKEGERILRIADRIQEKAGFFGIHSNYKSGGSIAEKYTLSKEQLEVFEGAVYAQRLVCVQGRAGTGKSHVMTAIKEMYESNNFRVRGLAPTANVARDLEDKGFEGAQNLHQFLFQQKNGRDLLGKREVLMVDEAGMVDNLVMQEVQSLAWKKGCQLILVGDDRQLPSVVRGGMFKAFCERYGAHELTEVRRQEVEWQRQMSEGLSQGDVHGAVDLLEKNNRLHWHESKQDSMEALVLQWAKDKGQDSETKTFILEHRNGYAMILNEMVRNVRKEWGELKGTEYACDTFLGTCYISEGDRIQFRKKDKDIGVINGTLGTVKSIKEDLFVIETDHGKEVAFNPNTFDGYQLGYAGTYHQSQGKTVEKTYVAHSPYSNENLFYVGVTRQQKDVHYFVSKDESKNKEVLVQQLERDASKETIVTYMKPKRESILDKVWNYVRDRAYSNPLFYQRAVGSISKDISRAVAYPATQFESGNDITTIVEAQITTAKSKADMAEVARNIAKKVSLSRTKRVNQNDGPSIDHIVDQLKERMPDVCRALMNETPTQQKGDEWRYGTKGSMKVNVSGPKAGGFANFETGEKGGPLHLICAVNNCRMKDAIEWSKEYLQLQHEAGHNDRDISRAQATTSKSKADIVEMEFKSILPTKEDKKAPELGQGCLAKLAAYNKETARYTYTNESGDTLFHVIRLESKHSHNPQKMTLPLSLVETPGGRRDWALKKYKDGEKTPIYNIKELVNNPSKPVLVVEGEKASESAKKQFPDMVVVSWCGGASATKLTNWSVMKDRDIVIWPDNDKAGQKAAISIQEECQKNGARVSEIVNLKAIQKDVHLPEKWDLADKRPKGISEQDIQNHLEKALTKGHDKVPGLSKALESIKTYRDLEKSAAKIVKEGDISDLSDIVQKMKEFEVSFSRDKIMMEHIKREDKDLFDTLKQQELSIEKQHQFER